MKKKNTAKEAKIRKKLRRRIEMARNSAFRMTPREEEVYLIVDGNSSRVCNLYARDGAAYSVYITAEPSVLHTEPFFTIYNDASPVMLPTPCVFLCGSRRLCAAGKIMYRQSWN